MISGAAIGTREQWPHIQSVGCVQLQDFLKEGSLIGELVAANASTNAVTCPFMVPEIFIAFVCIVTLQSAPTLSILKCLPWFKLMRMRTTEGGDSMDGKITAVHGLSCNWKNSWKNGNNERGHLPP